MADKDAKRWWRAGKLTSLLMVLAGLLGPLRAEDDQGGTVDDYNQWKQALGVSQATDPATLTVAPGFVVERLRSARREEGSWISLTFDPRGRLLVGREDRGVLRMTLAEPSARPAAGAKNAAAPPTEAEGIARVETVNDTLLECRGLLWAYDALYTNANNSKGLYRLRYDAAGDRFAEPELLRATSGGVGHGRNDLVLGPDGDIYLVHGDDVRLPADFSPVGSRLQHYSDERLLPNRWDNQLFNASMVLPGGHVVRTDREGKKWELFAGGLRNPYGLAFHPDGELFTFDADMEWDVGMPWYRPTRVLHLVSGADYGWRKGTGTWRSWFPESLPATADVGLGSPTAIAFGTPSHFPPKYRQALFILDWAYGRILAVRLTPEGATYQGELETFLSGRPLNVTDLTFGPDGAMYVLTGGRKTQSGLYRVRYAGPKDADEAAPQDRGLEATAAAQARQLRRQLERWHGVTDPEAVTFAWKSLGHTDPWIRHAARVAVEHQRLEEWRARALQEENSAAAVTALLALARIGTAADRDPLAARLTGLPWDRLSSGERITAVRALVVALSRHGLPAESDRAPLAQSWGHRYPDPSSEVNQLLVELLVALRDPAVVEKTLPLVAQAKTQEEKFHYLVTLRHVPGPWREKDRRRYLEWVGEARGFYGAQYLPRYLQWLQEDITGQFSDEERRVFGTSWNQEPKEEPAQLLADRPHVRQWQLDDLAGSLDTLQGPRDFARGKATFTAALCIRCHRLGTEGSPIGPDLSSVSRRFGRRDLLLSILAPSQVIDEKYQASTIVTRAGQVIVGQVTGSPEAGFTVLSNLLYPDQVVAVRADEIESQTPSLVSTMPAGLLNTFSRDEILDLLAYVEAAGDPAHPAFQAAGAPRAGTPAAGRSVSTP